MPPAFHRSHMNANASTMAGWAILSIMLCQFVPLNRAGGPPAREAKGDLPAELHACLAAKCGTCHTASPQWPRTAYVAPLSWYVVHRAKTAATAFDIATVPDGDAGKDLKRRIAAMLASGSMERHGSIPGFRKPGLDRNDVRILTAWSRDRQSATGEGD